MELFNDTDKYEKKVYVLPKKPDEEVARLHLEKVGVRLSPSPRNRRTISASPWRVPIRPTFTATKPYLACII